mmetsp:Transcript_38533/g.120623  ORF Transcript_38533/g.120623 Transcript_38533/m.120623 type:complete len:96 (+) Transcript_38533:61-348(+)
MAMGPGLRTSMGDRIPMDIKVGEFARFRDFVGADIDMDGENFRVSPSPSHLILKHEPPKSRKNADLTRTVSPREGCAHERDCSEVAVDPVAGVQT